MAIKVILKNEQNDQLFPVSDASNITYNDTTVQDFLNSYTGNNNSIPATETTYGTIKAKNRTNENNEVAIDTETGKLYANAATIGAKPIVDGTNFENQQDVVVEYWFASDGLSWYRKWLSGWKECGGVYYKGSSVAGTITVNFPFDFSNTLYSFNYHFLYNGTGGSSNMYGENYTARTISSATFNDAAGWYGYQWKAEGF